MDWQMQTLHCIQRETLAQHEYATAMHAMNDSCLRLLLLVFKDI
jgi:hypothetical protein